MYVLQEKTCQKCNQSKASKTGLVELFLSYVPNWKTRFVGRGRNRTIISFWGLYHKKRFGNYFFIFLTYRENLTFFKWMAPGSNPDCSVIWQFGNTKLGPISCFKFMAKTFKYQPTDQLTVHVKLKRFLGTAIILPKLDHFVINLDILSCSNSAKCFVEREGCRNVIDHSKLECMIDITLLFSLCPLQH